MAIGIFVATEADIAPTRSENVLERGQILHSLEHEEPGTSDDEINETTIDTIRARSTIWKSYPKDLLQIELKYPSYLTLVYDRLRGLSKFGYDADSVKRTERSGADLIRFSGVSARI